MGFAALILIGAGLLCLPCSATDNTATPFIDCLFTATSATCVTGLVTVDTGLHWSLFGQIVIICLIQIGGLGFMTILSMLFIFLHKRISLTERKLLMHSAGGMQLSDIMKIVKRAVIVTFTAEGLGAVVLFLRFLRDYSPTRALYYAVFHSISAFCNAGFDLLSYEGSASFSAYYGDPVINITLMLLIIFGGLGFLVWNNIFTCRFRVRKFELHTKIVLISTAVLLVGGTVILYLTDRNHAFRNMSEGERWLAAAFQSVTTRTAGFFTVDMTALSDSGSVVSMLLMLIGGSPGSTAGGIKTTTFAVLIAATVSCARNRGSAVMFKRRIDEDTVRQATAIAVIYVAAILLSTVLLCSIEGAGLREASFEVVSAVATVGLTQALTPSLSAVSKLIVAFLMYAGRLGGLSLVLALAEKRVRVPIDRPVGKILIG